MSKRRYTKVQQLLQVIEQVPEAGMSLRQEKNWEPKEIALSMKTVLRIMKKYGLMSEIRRCRKWVNLGQQAQKKVAILKTECIYRHKPNSFQEANDLIDRYIYFYKHERTRNKSGVTPLTLRHSA